MGTFLSSALRAAAIAAAALCIAAGFGGVAEWSLALPASLPFVFLAELAGIIRHRLQHRSIAAGAVIHAEERFRFISAESRGDRGRDSRAA